MSKRLEAPTTPPRPTQAKRRSSLELCRDVVGHHAEHEAAHRLTEKVGFAVAEHTLIVGEGVVARVLDDLKLKRLSNSSASWFSGGGANATAASERALAKLFPWRFVPKSPRTATSLAFDGVVNAAPAGAIALIGLLRILMPAFGCYLIYHMARHDHARAAKEWREKRDRATTALLALACLCDAADAAIHGAIVFAHCTARWHLVSHHDLHALETRAIQLAAVAFLAMIVGEAASNNRKAKKKVD